MIDITGKSPSLRESEALAIIKVSKLDTINIVNSLNKINIFPIVKNESESARLAGFGIINNEKKIYVHKDEYLKAKESIKSVLQ